jgi:DNA modification methylase
MLESNLSIWTGDRDLPSFGTNRGAPPLPFQTWHRFKESFAPELIAQAVKDSPIPVSHIIDPFGGSGTSALAGQFLGVATTSVEVNPFLADMIRAKTARYDTSLLTRELRRIVRAAKSRDGSLTRFRECPATLIEPGRDGKYVFGADAAAKISALIDAIDESEVPKHRILFRVILGGILVGCSNTHVNGKGRRYRQNWQSKKIRPDDLVARFANAASDAIVEIHNYDMRPDVPAQVFTGDSRTRLNDAPVCDLAVFSPPYPNSFDYTDVYNIELWMLGYFREKSDNEFLRKSALSSHVQLKRDYPPPPKSSPLLDSILTQLKASRNKLWCLWIPEMIGAYFHDMVATLQNCANKLTPGGTVWLIVGNSRYVDIDVPVDEILVELSSVCGLSVIDVQPCRSMRVSAQQGGKPGLRESLVILRTKASGSK